MASKKIESNMFFINAPAGSGKTHFIKDEINRIIDKNPSVRILCITYTERAAKELQARILSKETFISTIHSFINSFITPYYAHPETIELYYEIYKDDIEKRIQKNKILDTDDPENRNTLYLISKEICLSSDISTKLIKENTDRIYYNERSFNTSYYGGLSHDNLLVFTFALLEKYPILKFRLREMFQYIFVDEVQDTDTKILSLFYNAVKGTSTRLYYFGDKMQEIYENYDGGFENEYKTFNSSLSIGFKYNYRSSYEIVEVLNNLYGRKGSDRQSAKNDCSGIIPKLIICSNIEEYYSKNADDFDEFLTLRIANRSRFARANPKESMETIFDAIQSIYPHGSRITSIDVMLPPVEKNNESLPLKENSPDILINFFYTLGQMKYEFDSCHYAKVIQMLKNHTFVVSGGQKKNLFHSSMKLLEHDDKVEVQNTLEGVFNEFTNCHKYNLKQFLIYLVDQKMISNDFIEHVCSLENDEGEAIYDQLLTISLSEMKLLIHYKDNQSVSTQHGVKGEGHSKVCFWSEDSRRYRPYVYMYRFFKMYTEFEEFNFDEFQKFYYNFKASNAILQQKLEQNFAITKISRMRSNDITVDNIFLFDELIAEFLDNRYFEYIFMKDILDYKSKRERDKVPTLTSIRNIFKPDTVNRILVAYKLFYVGCSRAKDELIVLVNQEEINSFENEFKDKMISVGFEVQSVGEKRLG